MSRRRNWCFTDFEDLDFKDLWCRGSHEDKKVRYLGWGQETCPTSGKKHNQGWVQFKKAVRMSSVKKWFKTKKMHIEPCKGNEEQNTTYCSKENYQFFGEYMVQGTRTDIKEILDEIKSGTKMLDIAELYSGQFIRYWKSFQKYKELCDHEAAIDEDWREVEVYIHHGPTGTGKTRAAKDSCDKHDRYMIGGDQLDWWDHYAGEKTLIIDEYSNDIKINKLLRLLDGNVYRLPIKGSTTFARWTTVHITTNLTKGEFHSLAKLEHLQALDRRVTKWIQY